MNDSEPAPKSIWGGLIEAILHTEDGTQKIADDPTLQSITKRLSLLEETKTVREIQGVLKSIVFTDYERHWINSPLLDQLFHLRRVTDSRDYHTYSAGWGHYDAIKFLLDRGADAFRSNDFPLIEACLHGHFKIVELLFDRGANINVFFGLPLGMACIGGHFNVVEYLLEKGANITNDANNNHHPLPNASQFGHFLIVKLLLEKGANLHAHDNAALRHASECGHLEIVQYLLEKGANMRALDDEALYKASRRGHIKIVQLFLTRGVVQSALNHALRGASAEGKD